MPVDGTTCCRFCGGTPPFHYPWCDPLTGIMEYTSFQEMAEAFARCADPELWMRRFRRLSPVRRGLYKMESALWLARLRHQEAVYRVAQALA